ncbi:hypothetical protein H4V96_000857 [Janthinobacterium sp. CG_23.4]|nr:hypothetical protein [Janthinobacterium sp. CG_23.4]
MAEDAIAACVYRADNATPVRQAGAIARQHRLDGT